MFFVAFKFQGPFILFLTCQYVSGHLHHHQNELTMKAWKKAVKGLGIVKGKTVEGRPWYEVYGAQGSSPPLGRLQAPTAEPRINKS